MANGRIVYTLEDLKKVYDETAHGIKGMWAFHCNFHDGHRKCAGEASMADWTLAIIWNNYAEGMKLITGLETDSDVPLNERDKFSAMMYSDVVMVFTGDYHPYLENKDEYIEEVERVFGRIEDDSHLNTLIYSVAVRRLIHDTYGIQIDYHPSCGRDTWRDSKYVNWCQKNFGIDIRLNDAVCDKLGNCISGTRLRMTKKWNDRINKELLPATTKTIKELREYLKDIKDLEVISLKLTDEWITAKLQFKGPGGKWWYEGKRRKK